MSPPTPMRNKHIATTRSLAACPRPDEIRRLTKALRLCWSTRERRERAGLARQLQSTLRERMQCKTAPDCAAD